MATKRTTLFGVFTRQFLLDRRDKICAKLPAGVDRKAIFSKLVIELDNNPALYECDPTSLIKCLIEATVNGLEIGGLRRQAYIVPYGRVAKLIPSYIGYLTLLDRTGKLLHYTAECVHECDTFSWTLGLNEDLKHVPSTAPNRDSIAITHVYVIMRLTNGANVINVWTAAQIDAHKERYSKGWQRSDSPWQTAWRQMAIKTVVLDTFHRGRLPMDQSITQYIEREKQVTESFAEPIDLTEFEPPPSITDQSPPPEPTADEMADQSPPPEPPADEMAAFLRAVKNAKDAGDIAAVRTLYADKIDDIELDAICTDREEQLSK